jgi:hypothetical protein
MRTISSDGLAKLTTTHGNEPVCILEIDWSEGGVTSSYADKDIAGPPAIPGKIVELGDLDEAIDVTMQNSPSQEIAITLDDTDGALKKIFDAYDIHKRPVRLYQWFTGLALSDKFLVFSGKINTPASWNERDRTVKFSAVSQIEDKEIGFSADEGQFPFIPADLVGKAWPMVFGLAYDYPALKMSLAVTGTTLQGVGILGGQQEYSNSPLYVNGSNRDDHKLMQMSIEHIHYSTLMQASELWQIVDPKKSADLLDAANKLNQQLSMEAFMMLRQEKCAVERRALQMAEADFQGEGANPVHILGGEDFPQNTPVTIQIGSGLFHGVFQGDAFYISSRVDPQLETELANQIANTITNAAYQRVRLPDCQPIPDTGWHPYDFRVPVPCTPTPEGTGNSCEVRNYGLYKFLTPPPGGFVLINSLVNETWYDAGSPVRLYTDPTITYIASITPGTVLAVKAFQSVDGVRRLTPVPQDLYTIETKTYGSVTAVQVVLKEQLSQVWFVNAHGDNVRGWSDELYITFQSSVGPNIVDTLEYIIDNYTDLTYDADSFNYVRTKLAPFPANFPLLQRKNVVQVLKEICFQSRCALWLEDNVVYIKYLPEEPTPVGTITVSDIDADKGMAVELAQRTEDIVTKMNITWRLTNVPAYEFSAEQASQSQYMVLRHNVQRYGLWEKDYDWYIFNQPDIILKMATFWLIRLSSAWKRVKFRTYLHKLPFEAFDCLTLDATGYVALGPVKMVVEKADYNSAENCIDFECATPVRGGTLVQDPFYWPAALPQSTTWPSQADIDSGNAGGGGLGTNASGTLPVGDTSSLPSKPVFLGGPNVVFSGPADWGDRTPTDVGFAAQALPAIALYQDTPGIAHLPFDFTPVLLAPGPSMQIAQDPHPLVIDLSTTTVMDSKAGVAKYGYFGDVFRLTAPGDNSHGALALDVNAQVVDSSAGDLPAASPQTALKQVLVVNDGQLAIDLTAFVTNVTDSTHGALSDVFIVQNDLLMVDGQSSSGVKIITDDAPDGALFDFKLDTNTGKLGAGTAFLQSP